MIKLVYNKISDKWDLFMNNRLLMTFTNFQRALDMSLHVASLVERGFIE